MNLKQKNKKKITFHFSQIFQTHFTQNPTNIFEIPDPALKETN